MPGWLRRRRLPSDALTLIGIALRAFAIPASLAIYSSGVMSISEPAAELVRYTPSKGSMRFLEINEIWDWCRNGHSGLQRH